MEFALIIVVAAVVFGLCFLTDKLFTKLFRGKQQHHSGLAVRLSKRYGSIGLIMAVVGLAAVFAGISDGALLTVCGGILILAGIGMVVYYMTFGIFYDEDAFVYTSLGKKSITYRYADIQCQQLYNSYGNIVIELQMAGGRTVQLQSVMDGVYPFMDKAFAMWLQQTGRRREDCPFYDPQNSCWFPSAEQLNNGD